MTFSLLSLQSAEKRWSRQEICFLAAAKLAVMIPWLIGDFFLRRKERRAGRLSTHADQQRQQQQHQHQQHQQHQLISTGRDRGPGGKPFTGSQGARALTPGIILWEGKTGGFQTSPTRVYACKCPSTWTRYLGWMFTTGNLISWDVTFVWQLETAD